MEKAVKTRYEYPVKSFEEAVSFILKFKDLPNNRIISYDNAARALEVSAGAKKFTYTLSAARQFGLLTTGYGAAFKITEKGYNLIYPKESETTIRKIKLECIKTPLIYKELIEKYDGMPVPPKEEIENTLILIYSLSQAVAKTAAKVFLETIKQVAVNKNGILYIDTQFNRDDKKEKSEVSNNKYKIGIKLEGESSSLTYSIPISINKDDAECIFGTIKFLLKRLYKI